VTLPEVVMGDLAGKFGEISLYNQHADFELGSDSNSNSMSPWAIACEPAIEPLCADSPLHEHFPYGLCIASKAHAKALSARRAGKEIISEYDSDSNPISGYTRRQIRLLARPQARRPNRWELTLRRLPRLTSLSGGNTASAS
jgi:hypothetical protein